MTKILLGIPLFGLLYLVVVFLVAGLDRHSTDNQVMKSGRMVPPITVGMLLLLLMGFSVRSDTAHDVFLHLHHIAFLLLGAFLAYVTAILWQIYGRIAAENPEDEVTALYRRMWIATELVPAPVALAILVSGARLVWEQPGVRNPSQFPVAAMTVAFGLFFWDGIMGFQPAVRRMRRGWDNVVAGRMPITGARLGLFEGTDSRVVLLHVIAWPLVVAEGLTQWSPSSPLAEPVSAIQRALVSLPYGWPEAMAVVGVWLIAGLFVWLLRSLWR